MPEDCRPPVEAQTPPSGQATFSAEDFEGDDEDEEEDDEDEAALLSPDEDEDLSPLPDLSPPARLVAARGGRDDESEDPDADEDDAGSEAVDPLRLSVR